jgi:hypothetical protein
MSRREDTKTQSFLDKDHRFVYFFSHLIFKFSASLRLCALVLLFAFGISAQNLPDEIRGYKIHKAKISVTNQTGRFEDKNEKVKNEKDRNQKDKSEKNKNEKGRSEALARLTDPELTDTSLSGLTFEISAVIDPLDYTGKVDFLTFKDFKVNGLEVEIEEYKNPFEFEKNQPIALPAPVKIFLGSRQALKGALNEVRGSKEEWTVTGTVFVFGRFKKWGFNIKRVVPVEVNVKIKNPLKKENVTSPAMPSF